MIRRWLIRLSFLLILAFVVGAWIASYFGELDVYRMTKDFYWDIGTLRGLTFMGVDISSPYPEKSLTIDFVPNPADELFLDAPTTMGFYCGPVPRWRDAYVIILPLWLPTFVLIVLLWYGWRKTRPVAKGKAFPVEPVKISD